MTGKSQQSLTLVSHHLCPYVQRAAILLDEKRIPHRRRQVDLSDKPDWFRRISPLGRVPLLIVDQEVLFESAVICEYLDEVTAGSLHPEDPLEKASHRSFIEFASAVLNDIAGFYGAKEETAFEDKRTALAGKFRRLEAALGEGPYFAGKEFRLVDAAFGPVFRYFDSFEEIADFGFFSNLPKVAAYRAALSRRPSVATAVDKDYPRRLQTFLLRRNSHLSALMTRTTLTSAAVS